MSCCERLEVGNAVSVCSVCNGDIDEDGSSAEKDNCGYSSSVCDTCNWCPCDESC